MQLVFALSEIAENQNHRNQNNAPPHGGYGVRDYLVLARDFGRELARWAIPAHNLVGPHEGQGLVPAA